jgi:hypothetical protein
MRNQIPPAAVKAEKSNITISLDVVPIPTSTELEVSSSLRERQSNAIKGIKAKGKDLFEDNKTVVTRNAGNRLYQTADLYGQMLAVEDLIPLLTGSDLTMRVNAKREGDLSQNTCMELTTGMMADLLEKESADSRGEKSCQMSLKSAKDQGTMYVGMKVQKGKHYIQKVDYSVADVVDSKLHI